MTAAAKLEADHLEAWYRDHQVLHGLSMRILEGEVTALIGPSGCGKTTLLRCFNRLHEEAEGSRSRGKVLLDGEDIQRLDPVSVRFRVGMVFQRPVPFPNLSIFENVAAGLRLMGVRRRDALDEGVVDALLHAGLWEEVKDRLDAPGTGLSGGQQQRLCIARALAVRPEVLLMDEPCSSLDPIASSHIEKLILALAKEVTVVIATHNLPQASRVSDRCAFLYLGKLVEFDATEKIFQDPAEQLTQNYITGRFG